MNLRFGINARVAGEQPRLLMAKARTMKIVAYLLLMFFATGAAAQIQTSVDYDNNDNNLIDVRDRAQLQAITHDLMGVGNAAAAAYRDAFPDAIQGMGCPSTCTGYELLNDIDLSGANWNPIGGGSRASFPAILPDGNHYNRVFEGNGHVISNMSIDGGNSDWDFVGLFRGLGAASVVRNVGLVDVNVSLHTGSFSFYTGALAGTAHGRIASSYVAGGTVSGGFYTGSLVGDLRARGIIIASYTNVSIPRATSQPLGGLVGRTRANSIVSASYTLVVSENPSGFGGLVGQHDSAAEIQSSYFDKRRARVSSCCDSNAPSPDRSPKSSVALRTPTSAVEIYAGWDKLDLNGAGTNDDAPWDFGNPFQYPVLRGNGNTTNIGVQQRLQPPVFATFSQRGGALAAEGSTATYAVELGGVADVATMSWSVVLTGVGTGHAVAADFSTTRGTVTLVNTDSAVFQIGIARDQMTEGRETFRVQLSDFQAPANSSLSAARSTVVSVIARSGGTDYDLDGDNLIEVATTSQLSAIRYDLGGMGLLGVADGDDADAYKEAFPFFNESSTCPGTCAGYELSNDLDLSSVGNWTPLGGGSPLEYYTAVFEGNGHVISNLRIESPSLNNAGLFSAVGVGGRIRNVGLRDVFVSVGAGVHTGALVGRNEGRVAACYVLGGSVDGQAGRVKGVWGAGGLAGANGGTVIASYADVGVHADAHTAGGLIGEAIAGSVVSASYSVGMVSGGRYGGSTVRGGLLGRRNESDADKYDVQASYYDRGRSGQTSCCGGQTPPSSDAHTSRTSLQLRAPTSAVGIYAGWDKLDVDGVDQLDDDDLNDDAPWDFGSGFDYPVLRGVSARYPKGNTTGIRVQRPVADVLVTLSQGVGRNFEGGAAEYAVTLSAYGAGVVTMNWSVELTGVGEGHADADDFSEATRGEVVLVNTDSAVFSITIRDGDGPEGRETFRVRLSEPRGLDGLRLSAASSAVVSSIERNRGMDYDRDGDNLIEVATTSQLSAIRYDLGGMGLLGVADGDDADAYEEAFPFFNESSTCPGTCAGYELSNDLDLSSVGNWTPLGGGSPLEYYTAVFEGNGHVISNLRIESPSLNNAGLFSAVGVGGRIRNVGLRDVFVSVGAGVHTGALVGRNEGRVAACYVLGGSVDGQAGRVKGVWGAGGLAGANGGTVIASYADVGVHADAHTAGGLIGEAIAGSVVSASYSVGMVSGGRYGGSTVRGGLLGRRNESDADKYDVQASYYDRGRSGQTSCCGGQTPPSSDAHTSRTSLQLRAPTSAVGIYAGWDKLDVDGVDQLDDDDLNDDAPWDFGSGFDYPVLRGVSARFPGGNAAGIGVQRRLQPQVLLTLSQRGADLLTEGQVVEYTVELDGRVSQLVMNWSVEYTGAGDGHAEASDFDGDMDGVLVLTNTSSADFQVRIADDVRPELRETFRVRVSGFLTSGALRQRLNVASSAVVSVIASHGKNYDADDNGLIDVMTTSQLSAIRYDLRGMGLGGVDGEDVAAVAAYEGAFPFFDEIGACAGGCKGYELLNDVDLSGLAWQPIGGGGLDPRVDGRLPEKYLYKAVFEGNGHVISNMEVNAPNVVWHFVGLFRGLGAGGVIRNVGLMGAKVAVHMNSISTGGLAGVNYGGKVAACYVVGEDDQGDVIGSWTVGGLVGGNEGTIIASYANAYVRGAASPTGGLVGYNAPGGKIIASYSLGIVGLARVVWPHATRNDGGLVGQNDAASTAIEASYYDRDSGGLSSGGTNVSATAVRTSRELRSPVAAEGIYAAWSGLNVDDTTGTVMGVLTLNDDNPWDFGTNLDYPVLRGVSERYPDGNTTGIRAQRLAAGVFVTLSQGAGRKSEGEEAEYAVTLSTRGAGAVTMNWSVELTGVGEGHAEALDFDGATSGQVVLAGTASAVFQVGIKEDETPERRETFRVRISDLQGPDNVRLNPAGSAVVSVIAPNGRDYDPDGNNLINVATTSQLAAIRYDLGGAGLRGVADGDVVAYDEAFPFFDKVKTCAGGCKGYELSNDVDLSSVRNWTPLGGGNPIKYYTAVFEGNGHVVSNLRIQSSLRLDNAGLFGAVSGVGTIRNVGLRDVSVEVGGGSMHTGALVGRNEGKVAACYVTGGSVKGVFAAGGLAGANHGTVLASYAAVGVHADGLRSGGLIGRAAAGSVVSASYSIGRVTGGARGGSTYRGGLVGGRDEADAAEYDVQASYFDRARSGQSSCCGENEPSPDRSSRTSIELRAPTAAAGIYAGWDQLDVDGVASTAMGAVTLNDDAPWDFGSGLDYPVLRGVSARYPTGNTTSAGVQRRLQPPVSLTLSQRGADLVTEGQDVEYIVELDVPSVIQLVMNWSVEYTGAGDGHAEASDFDGDRDGFLFLTNTRSAVFQVSIADDGTPDLRETFRVRVSGFVTSSALRRRLNVASSAVVSVIAPHGKDYDPDGNNLINVATTSQLAAIRHDLGGAGLRGVADGDVVAYDEAFPFFDEAETCAGGCKGYELSNDVDLSSVRNWTPIGGGNPTKYYTAVFEGNGHVVSNLRIQSSLRLDNAGLFGAVSGAGTIRNVGLRDVNVEVGGGSMHTGALVGRNEGKVAASYVTGGRVKGVSATGGLAGANYGAVLASYAAVGVHADGLRSGGLIGRAAAGSVVSASYSIGRVTGGAHGASIYRGGLVGGRDEADAAEYDVQASYFDHARSGQSSCCGENEPSPDRSSRTSIELRAPTAAMGIYAGWDQLDVDGVASTAMGVVTLNDDAPWDFGSRFDYPALRGVSIRYPGGNTTSIRVQRQRQPSVPVVMLATPAHIRTTESDVELRFEVALSPATAVIGEDVTIHYQVSGTATAGADYRDEDGGMVVMAVGTTRAVIRLRLLDDYVIEPEEELVLQLLRTRGDSVAVATTRFSTVVTIANDDRLVVVDARVYLQGAYGGSRGMSTGLIDVLPRRQPYNVAPWNYPAATTVPHVGEELGLSGVTSTIVDWVLVELRTGATADAALASAPTTGGRAAGLLLRDGRIAGINEEAATAADTLFLNGVRFETELPEGQEVYVLVHHRNHLSVISANALAPGSEGCTAGYCVDFRFAQSHGDGQAEVGQGTYAMFAGDVDRNGVIDERDEVLIRVHNLRSLGAGAYRDPDAAGNYAVDADLDFDGEVLSADRCFMLAPGNQGRCRTFSAP